MKIFTGLAVGGLAVAQAGMNLNQKVVSILESRELVDTREVVNLVLGDFSTEFDGNIVDRLSVDDEIVLSIGTIANVAAGQSQSFQIEATGISGRVRVDLGGFFGTITVNLENTEANIGLVATSNDFAREVPQSFARDQSLDCDDIISLSSSSGGLVNIAIGAVEGDVCDIITDLIDNTVVPLINDVGIAELVGTRPAPVTDTLPALVAAAESALSLPAGFDFLDVAQLEAVGLNLLDELLASPLVTTAIAEAENLVAALIGNDEAAAIASINTLTSLIGVTIDTTIVSDLFLLGLAPTIGGLVNDVINGDLTIVEFAAIFIDLLGLEIPTGSEFLAFVTTLPDFAQEFLDFLGINDFIAEVLDGLNSPPVLGGRRLQGFDFSFITDLIDFTVGDVIALLPAENIALDFLNTFDPTTTVIDAAIELGTIVVDAVSEFTSGIDVNVADSLSDAVTQLIEYVGLFVPAVADISALIAASGGNLELVADSFAQTVAIDLLGEIVLTPDSFSLNLPFALNTADIGLNGDGTVIAPGLDLSAVSFSVGLGLDWSGPVTFSDTVVLQGSFDLATQQAVTFAFDYASLNGISLAGLTDLASVLDVGAAAATCFTASSTATLSAQKTDADFGATFSTTSGLLDGAGNSLINQFLVWYAPAVPTLIESLAASAVTGTFLDTGLSC